MVNKYEMAPWPRRLHEIQSENPLGVVSKYDVPRRLHEIQVVSKYDVAPEPRVAQEIREVHEGIPVGVVSECDGLHDDGKKGVAESVEPCYRGVSMTPEC